MQIDVGLDDRVACDVRRPTAIFATIRDVIENDGDIHVAIRVVVISGTAAGQNKFFGLAP